MNNDAPTANNNKVLNNKWGSFIKKKVSTNGARPKLGDKININFRNIKCSNPTIQYKFMIGKDSPSIDLNCVLHC